MTDSDIADEVAVGLHGILKRDSRGRVLTTQEQRRALLQAFENSGLSGPQFARVAGINYQTFATWRQQHKRQACETKDSSNLDTGMVGFVEAVMQGPQDAASALSLSPPRSVTLRFYVAKGMPLELKLSHRDQLPLVAAFIKALQQPC